MRIKPPELLKALAEGALRYNTGKPCKHGHYADRYVSNSNCLACSSITEAKQNASKPGWRSAINKRSNMKRKARLGRSAFNRLHKKLPVPTRPEPLLCECCQRWCSRNDVLCLDHCHETNTFRGWLCNDCNLGLGRLGDNIEGIRSMLAYLERAASNTPVG